MDNEDIVREHQQILDLAKSNKKRIDTLEEGIRELRDLAAGVSAMALEQKHIREDLSEMKGELKQITEKPGKRWDAMVEKALTLITAGVVAYILGQIGL